MENFKKLKMQEIVESIVEDMKKGVLPWEQPWVASGLCPANATTRKIYRGINVLYLAGVQNREGYKVGRWITFHQASLAGGRIKAGEKGWPVVFYDRTTKKETANKPDGTKEEKLKTFSLLKFFTVFNLDQTEGLDKLYPTKQEKRFEDVEAAEALIVRSGANLVHVDQGKAFYSPSTDRITLPPKESFKTAAGYYSTAFHEISQNAEFRIMPNRFHSACFPARNDDFGRHKTQRLNAA